MAETILGPDPAPFEDMAAGIERIAQAAEMIQKSGLNRSALLILVCARTGMSLRDVGAVLDSLNSLRAAYLS